MNYSTDEISLIQEANKVADLPPKIAEAKHLGALAEIDIPDPNKDVVSADALQHRHFIKDEFWKKIPAFKDISKKNFLNTK
ncbi:MAG: hypothetical protein AB7O48_17925 [Cyclobacteriaceae bacterium]